MEKVLVLDDEQSMVEFLEYALQKEGYQVSCAQEGETALKLLGEGSFDLIISDLRMPNMDGLEVLKECHKIDPDVPFIFMTAYASSDTAIEALKLGAFDYITKPFQVEELKNLIKNALLARNLKHQVELLKSQSVVENELIGTSPPMLEIYKLVGTIAPTKSTVLITGESGTGKELVARAIHQAGPVSQEPFVSINCGAFPETLLETELFGHMKGAFTGATSNKKGLFEAAIGGTLFLDEIGEMSPTMQVKLLRALQEKKIRRVGGTDELDIDARVVAATNRKLEEQVETGEFREDLYYRLAVIPIHVPPLRERVTDIVPLARHFIQKYNERLGRNIRGTTEEGLACLEAYFWPGNVRELENVIERAVTLETGEFIQKERLPARVRGEQITNQPALPRFSAEEGFDLDSHLKEVETHAIEQGLRLANGNQTRAAELLKVTYRSLRHRMETLGIKKKQSPKARG